MEQPESKVEKKEEQRTEGYFSNLYRKTKEFLTKKISKITHPHETKVVSPVILVEHEPEAEIPSEENNSTETSIKYIPLQFGKNSLSSGIIETLHLYFYYNEPYFSSILPDQKSHLITPLLQKIEIVQKEYFEILVPAVKIAITSVKEQLVSNNKWKDGDDEFITKLFMDSARDTAFLESEIHEYQQTHELVTALRQIKYINKNITDERYFLSRKLLELRYAISNLDNSILKNAQVELMFNLNSLEYMVQFL